jgi:hypothetical protein
VYTIAFTPGGAILVSQHNRHGDAFNDNPLSTYPPLQLLTETTFTLP